jgi:hypothetical protein
MMTSTQWLFKRMDSDRRRVERWRLAALLPLVSSATGSLGAVTRATRLVVLVNANPKQRWLREAVEKRLREELGKLEVEVNEDRTYRAELSRGESFGFLNLRKVVPNAFPVLVAYRSTHHIIRDVGYSVILR